MLHELADIASGCEGKDENDKPSIAAGNVSLSPRLAGGFQALCKATKLKFEGTKLGGGGYEVPCKLLVEVVKAAPRDFKFDEEVGGG